MFSCVLLLLDKNTCSDVFCPCLTIYLLRYVLVLLGIVPDQMFLILRDYITVLICFALAG